MRWFDCCWCGLSVQDTDTPSMHPPKKSQASSAIYIHEYTEDANNRRRTCTGRRRSYWPYTGLAAASTEQRALSEAWMPALAMVTVCCSITCVVGVVLVMSVRMTHTDRTVPVVGDPHPPKPAHPTNPQTYLVNRYPVRLAHLVELVDAHRPAVGQHHGARLEPPVARVGVGHCGRLFGGRWVYACTIISMYSQGAHTGVQCQDAQHAPTAAVRPTPEEPRPVVEMARREVLSTALYRERGGGGEGWRGG